MTTLRSSRHLLTADALRPGTSDGVPEEEPLRVAADHDVSERNLDWVQKLVAASPDRLDQLTGLAERLARQDRTGVVAVSGDEDAPPRWLVVDESLAAGLVRDEVRTLLTHASPNVRQVSLRWKPATSTEHPDHSTIAQTGGTGSIRGLLVELLPAPSRASLLWIPASAVSDDKRDAAMAATDREGLGRSKGSDRLIVSAGYLEALAARYRETVRPELAAATDRRVTPAPPVRPEPSPATGDSSNAPSSMSLSVRSALRQFHRELDPKATAYHIASELPRLASCDRAIVLLAQKRLFRSTRYRVAAVSGVAVVDRRGPLIRSIERLAAAVAVFREPWVYPLSGTTGPDSDSDPTFADTIAPQVAGPLEDYLDASSASSVAVLPLLDRAPEVDAAGLAIDSEPEERQSRRSRNTEQPIPIGLLFLESFGAPLSVEQTGVRLDSPIGHRHQLIEEAVREAEVAVRNSIKHDAVFALPLRRPLAGITRRALRAWSWSALFLMSLAMVLGWWIKVDHEVMATGVARPVSRRAVFAAVDGVVTHLHVRDGDRVSAGDPLVALESPEIRREAEVLDGQLGVAIERLSSLKTLQASSQSGDASAARDALEQRALVAEIETLRRRIQMNQQRRNELTVRAPIEGVVVAWRIEERLRDRPVARGDRLLVVMDPDGPWELDLELEERRAGDVLNQYSEGRRLPIRFVIAGHPAETWHAELDSISGVARCRDDGIHVLDVTAVMNPSDVVSVRQTVGPGSRATESKLSATESERAAAVSRRLFRGDDDVTARIDCGRARLIDSWSRDLVAWFQRHVLFRFR